MIKNFSNRKTADIDESEIWNPQTIYWDNDGNLRHGRTTRNRDTEVVQVLQCDTFDDTDITKLW